MARACQADAAVIRARRDREANGSLAASLAAQPNVLRVTADEALVADARSWLTRDDPRPDVGAFIAQTALEVCFADVMRELAALHEDAAVFEAVFRNGRVWDSRVKNDLYELWNGEPLARFSRRADYQRLATVRHAAVHRGEMPSQADVEQFFEVVVAFVAHLRSQLARAIGLAGRSAPPRRSLVGVPLALNAHSPPLRRNDSWGSTTPSARRRRA